MADQLLTFVPVPGANYRYDFQKITAELSELAVSDRLKFLQFARFWCQESLFFLLYFVLRVPVNHPWLVDRINEVEECNDRTLDLWARESYKALAIDTRILTVHGWKCHGDLQPGDQIFGSKGQIINVIANTGAVEGADCRRIVFDDCEIIASSEHLWPVQEKVNHKATWENRFTEIIEKTDDLPLRIPYKRLPPTPIINLPHQLLPLPIDPYILGRWLGDGSGHYGIITVSSEDEDELLEQFDLAGFSYHIHRSGDNYTMYQIDSLKVMLRSLGLVCNKHIPYKYLESSVEDRLALLQGLMDSDGFCRNNGKAQCIFTNTNFLLASGVHYLAASLGLKPTIYLVKSVITERKDIYRVNFVGTKAVPPFRLKRKLAFCRDERLRVGRYIRFIDIVESVPVNCIQVDADDGIYLAGYSLVPTHNSTIITYGLNIKEILNDSNVRIGIFSHTRGIAKAFLRRIKSTFETNDFLKALFPDILYDNPVTQSPKWSEDEGLVVKRSSVFGECTVEAYGVVDGQPTSRHYSILNYDDLVTRDSVSTPDQVRKVEDCFRLSLNLGTADGKRRIIGTTYSFADLYEMLKKQGGWKVRIYPAEDENGDPVLRTKDQLIELRKQLGPYVYNCQQLLNPVAKEDQRFRAEWLKFYKKLPANLTLFLLCDPANTKKYKQSGGDFTVYWIWGIDSLGNKFLVDAVRDRLLLTERWTKLRNLVRKHNNIQKIGYEEYGMTADIQYFQERMAEEAFYFTIVPLGGTKLSKEDRILRMVPQFENGKVFLPEELLYKNKDGETVDLVKIFIQEEYLSFPFSIHDDLLDAASRIEDESFNYWRPYDGPVNLSDDPRPPQGVVTTGWADTKAESRFAGL